jgi:8-oxo-dGTP pyrophosphatase MutT (NUDIX family)
VTLHDDVLRVLATWQAPDPAQEELRNEFVDLLNQHPDGARRSCRVGHVTASALVLDAARERTLLTLHPKAGRWLQLGGHCEPGDATLAAAALREATEESGIEGLVLDGLDGALEGAPLRLSRHPVRCTAPDGSQGPSVHFDVQYATVAPPAAVARISSESLDLRWFPVDALPETDDSVRALVTAATGC